MSPWNEGRPIEGKTDRLLPRRAMSFSRRMVLRFVACFWLATLLSGSAHPTTDQHEEELDKSAPPGMTVEELVRRFTSKERQWKQLREQYSFRQTIKVQTLEGDEVRAEYQNVAEIRYQNGKRIKNVLLGPQPSLQMTPEDFEDIESRASFTISTDELSEYNMLYAGRQKVDELHCYVFDVAPKQTEKGKRYFAGRIWVDDRDFQIVKNTGKSVPDIRIKKRKRIEENLFPQFTTWRQPIDNYWFPTFSSADDTLHFNAGDVHIRQILKFNDYKKMAPAGP